jgi:hypothetical protein
LEFKVGDRVVISNELKVIWYEDVDRLLNQDSENPSCRKSSILSIEINPDSFDESFVYYLDGISGYFRENQISLDIEYYRDSRLDSLLD